MGTLFIPPGKKKSLANKTNITEKEIWKHLSEVYDPEVPVLTIIDLGIVRDIQIVEDSVKVIITPTYSGCPAMNIIEQDITSKLKEKGIGNFTVETVLSPAWTTEWMSEEGKTKLKEYGIAPPNNGGSGSGKPKECPNCGSAETMLKSEFGSTACKALYVCESCKEPFDYFKCH